MVRFEKAIMTFVSKGEKIDLEVPLNVKINEIDYMIKSAIYNYNYRLINIQEECEYYLEDDKLEKGLSFSQQGIWEGSIIRCVQ